MTTTACTGASSAAQVPADLSGEGSILTHHEIKHPWFNQLSPFVHYRTSPVFMVPAHLTLGQLSKIMLESTVSFKTPVHGPHHSNDESLDSIYQVMSEDRKAFEL